MAEIKIEQKKPIWPWLLLGFIIAALLVYFLVFYDNSNNTAAVTETENITNTDNMNESARVGGNQENATVAAYINYVESNKGNMGLDHEYTNEALLKLIEATNAKANEVGYEVRADIAKAREYANMITRDPHATTHADNIRNAFGILTNVLQNIQKAKFPGLANEAEQLRSTSESVKPGTHTLEQKDAVKNYFAEASDLLNKMN